VTRRFDLLATYNAAEWPQLLFYRLVRRVYNVLYARWRRFADWEDAPMEIKIHRAFSRGDIAEARRLIRETGHDPDRVIALHDFDSPTASDEERRAGRSR
jgi:hypothetical protein